MLGIRPSGHVLLGKAINAPLKASLPRNSVRAFSQLSWTGPAHKRYQPVPFQALSTPLFGPLAMRKIAAKPVIAEAGFSRGYSTKTAPPPLPGPDRNAKGRALLHRITGFTTFTASLVLVVVGVAFCGLVVYLILSELLLPSGDTKTFNKAVNLVEKNAQAQQALQFQPGERLKAYGEVAGDQWVRNRPVQSVRQKGHDGKDHLAMKFHVESDAGRHGTVVLEQIDTSFWSSDFAYVALDLPLRQRIYIVEPKFAPRDYVPRPGVFTGSGFLGLNWGPKKKTEDEE